MSQRKSSKLAPVAAVLCLTAISACGPRSIAAGNTPAASGTATAARTASAAPAGLTAPAHPVASMPSSGRPASSPSGKASSPSGQAPAAAAGLASSSPASARPTSANPVSSAPPNAAAQGPACVTSADSGRCGPYADAAVQGGIQPYVIQDLWNPIGGATQTLTAYSAGTWSVAAKMPAANTAVVSYPDVQTTYTTTSNTPAPLSGFGAIVSSYAETSPAGSGGDYEAAYDIWTGTGSSNYAQETMIWVDNHGQTPAGSEVASATIDGVGYKVWSRSASGSQGRTVSLVLNANQASGSVNILDDLKWLMSNGYLPAGSGLNQIDFGWEICSTGGAAETFTMSQYGIKVS